MERIKARAAKGERALANSLLQKDISSYANTSQSPKKKISKEKIEEKKVEENQEKFEVEKPKPVEEKEDDKPDQILLQNNDDEDEREILLQKKETDENSEDVFTRYKKIKEKRKKRVKNSFNKNLGFLPET